MNTSIIQKITAIVSNQLGHSEDKIKPESSLVDALGADSLDIIEIVMYVEEEFDIEITDTETDHFSNTIADLAELVEMKVVQQ